MRRSARNCGVLKMLLILLTVTVLSFGNTPAFAATVHVDPARHATDDSPQPSHSAGCHTAGACHQFAVSAFEREMPSIGVGATQVRPAAVASPGDNLSEFDTPPPRA